MRFHFFVAHFSWLKNFLLEFVIKSIKPRSTTNGISFWLIMKSQVLNLAQRTKNGFKKRLISVIFIDPSDAYKMGMTPGNTQGLLFRLLYFCDYYLVILCDFWISVNTTSNQVLPRNGKIWPSQLFHHSKNSYNRTRNKPISDSFQNPHYH